jgi:hypothetical protein
MQSAISRVIIIDSYCSASTVSSDRSHTGKILEDMLTIELNQPT